MASPKNKAEVIAADEAQLAADTATPEVAATDTAEGASAAARKQQIANAKARQTALDEADVIAQEVADAKVKEDEAHAVTVAAQARHAAALAKAVAAGSAPIEAPSGMIITGLGLPNSCSKCGRMIVGNLWYARNEDAARAGQGFCADDAAKLSKPVTVEAGKVAKAA